MKKQYLYNYFLVSSNFLSNGMLLLVNLALSPFLIFYLSDKILSLWFIFLSFGSLSLLIVNGFVPVFSRSLVYAWNGASTIFSKGVGSKSDKNSVNTVLFNKLSVLSIFIFTFLGILNFVVFFPLGNSYFRLFFESSTTISLSWLIYLIGVSFNIFFSFFKTIMYGFNTIIRKNLSLIITSLVYFTLTVFLLFKGYGILGISISFLIKSVINVLLDFCFIIFSKELKVLNSAGFFKNDNETIFDLFKKIFPNSSKEIIVNLNNYLTGQVITLILPLTVGITFVSQYSFSFQILSAVSMLSTSFFSSLSTKFQNNLINLKVESNLKLLSISFIVFISSFTVLFFGILFFFNIIFEFLDISFRLNLFIFILLGLYKFLLTQHNFFCAYISFSNQIPYFKPFILSSIFGLILVFITTYTFQTGLIGIILSLLLSQLVFNNWYWPRFVILSFNKNFLGFLNIGVIQIKKYFSRSKY